jgi:ribonuclease-3 family protein
MKFDQYQQLVAGVLDKIGDGQSAPNSKYQDVEPGQLPALILAYVGDAFFTLYVRTRLLGYEQHKVRVLNMFSSQMVSAKLQAAALHKLEAELIGDEVDIVRRGRNTKSRPTKNASVSDYRYSTGFEALLGYLFLTANYPRLYAIADKSFVIISRKLAQNNQNGNDDDES